MSLRKTQKGYEVLRKVTNTECWLQLKEGQRSKRVSETQQHFTRVSSQGSQVLS